MAHYRNGTARGGALKLDRSFSSSSSARPSIKPKPSPSSAVRRSGSASPAAKDDAGVPGRVRVAVRLRPRNAEELVADADFADCVELQPELKRLKLRKNNWDSDTYEFDEVLTEFASQKRVYEVVAKPVVESVLEGYNGTVMAYGQTGTGKTYTMGRLGEGDTADRGIMVRSMEDIFADISLETDSVSVSYLHDDEEEEEEEEPKRREREMLVSRSKIRHLLPLFFSPCTAKSSSTTEPFLHSLCSFPKPYKNPPTPSLRKVPFSSLANPPSNFRSDGSNEESSPHLLVCLGCGVYMQDSDPKLPGFFIRPSPKSPNYKPPLYRTPVFEEPEISNSLKRGFLEESNDELQNPDAISGAAEKPVVCARCHSLRNYGKVKDSTVENLLPDFDFYHTIGRKLVTASGSRAIVLMVVDAADFDGSFPRRVAKLVSSTIEENSAAWKKGKPANVPRVVLVVTKIDLLPPSLSPTGFEYWVRQRAREGGANKLTSVHFVSAFKNWGLKNLVEDVIKLTGARGNVWAIGAQNAGKSTLINAIGKHVGGKVTHLTEAPVPGTTLGIIRVDGVLPIQARLFDTPGLLHPYQITTRLTREEQKLVHISKELKPRTYRLMAGHSVHMGGLFRLDIEKASVDSIYVTVWASPLLPLHMGKTENACTMPDVHFGRQLQPPIGDKRVAELGRWVKREYSVSGNSWDVSSVDVAAAGLGWFAIGLKGEALLGVWSYDGVGISVRSSLIPHRANIFEVTGFTVSNIVSRADRAVNKMHQSRREKKENDCSETEPSAVESALTLNIETSA